MKRFDYFAPRSLDEALEALVRHPEALPLAGGTDILVQMKERNRPVAGLVSLRRVPEMHRCEQNGALVLGAAVTAGQVAADPGIRSGWAALVDGAGLIGSVQIRNMATVGGNVCNASPSADTAPGLLALEAEALVAGPGGERRLPLEAFFTGPGRTALQPGELLLGLRMPRLPGRSGSAYLRHTPRAQMDLAFAGAAAALTLGEDGRIAAARIALGAVAPTPIRAREAEAFLVGQLPQVDAFEQAGALAAQAARPIDDLRASAEYRRHLVAVLTQRALSLAFARIG